MYLRLHQHISLFSRILLFLGAFLISLAMQMALESYQSTTIFTPLKEHTGNIQVISQFLNQNKETTNLYAQFRWEYGDVAQFLRQSRESHAKETAYLDTIQDQIDEIGRQQYLLVVAIKETFKSFSELHDQIQDLLLNGNKRKAEDLYYDEFVPCASYLSSYTQQLLIQAITDNQTFYSALMRRNTLLSQIRNLFLGIVMAFGTILVISLLGMLRPIQELSKRSHEIGQGMFDTPDVDESRTDEIGDMAKAFNAMKRSMKRQVSLLEEQNRIKSALYQKETEALGLQNLLEKQKLQMLRSQVNPHFLFNTLNVLMYRAKEEHATSTAQMLRSLSTLYHYATTNNATQVPLSRELQIVTSYASLCEARFGDRMRFTLILPKEIDVTEVMTPPFILQPLVENAFKHGLTPKEGRGTVQVRVGTDNDMLHLSVQDDGIGMDRASLDALRQNLYHAATESEHVGLANVASRLRLQCPQSQFHISSAPGEGMTVEMWLPLVFADTAQAEGEEAE